MDQQPDYTKQAMSEIIMSLTSNVIDLRAQLLATQAALAAAQTPDRGESAPEIKTETVTVPRGAGATKPK